MTGLIVKFPDRFVETAIDDETVVMDLDSAEFFSLNETAGAVWRAIDGSRDRDALIAAIAGDYGETAEAIAADVDAILAQFTRAGFIGNSA
ncbi:PqqD family protein [Novosphingobium sp. TH158]|uniref:PqqD family protein n=1 Tax=Novosphingobium sp. TH158 TaxID=2067455 RepID=UPI000C7E354A|nr:PqqD family protein [Novosphingobium sp. TH158]PLK27079.1 hypothetical protein C0V78_09435 [Novosphingobium sp. TH158]